MAGTGSRGWISVRPADGYGHDDLPQFLHADGFHPLYGVRQSGPVHGLPADQDGPAVDDQSEIYRRHPRVVFQYLAPITWRPELEMPATEDNFRSLRTMHVVSAASAFALLVATLWMMKADYADEWRGIQATNYKLRSLQIDEDLKSLTTEQFKQKEKELQDNVDSAEVTVSGERDKVAEAKKEVDDLDGQSQVLTRKVKFTRAERDAVRADLDLQVRDGKLSKKELQPFQKRFDDKEAEVGKLEIELQQLQAKFDAAKDHLAELTKPLDEAQAAKKKHETELDRLKKAKDKIDPPTLSAAGFKHWLMEQEIIEGFNGPLKIAQV